MATGKGLNGQQKAQKNVDDFIAWAASQSDDDYKKIIFRGQLNRGEIAKAVGSGESALNQNPLLKEQLNSLEDGLREKGILPRLTESAKRASSKPKQYDNTTNRKLLDSKRLSSLETENVELKAKVQELENRLKRFGELSETLAKMGFMQR